MKIKMTLLIITLIIISSGCTGQKPITIAQTETTIPTSTSELFLPTNSPSPISPAITGLPTITGGNAMADLMTFIRENGECILPCVLGLTPQSMSQTTAEDYVNYFENAAHGVNHLNNNLDIYTNAGQGDRGGVRFMLWEKDKHVQVGMGYSFALEKIAHILLFGEIYQQGDNSAQRLFGDPFFDSVLESFTLTKVLISYGPPQQVLVRADPDDPGHPSPPAQYLFRFLLFYPEKGFLVEYLADRINEFDTFSGCPTKPYSLHVFTWDPNISITLPEALEIFAVDLGATKDYYTTQNFKPIEDVTSFSISEFYKTFSAPDSQKCIQTNQTIWPTSTP
jgi:hypothetical protein